MNELEALIVLNNTPLVGPVRIRLLVEAFGSAVAALEGSRSAWEALDGFGPKVVDSLSGWRDNRAWEQDLEAIGRHGITVIPFSDPRYPRKLLETPDHPVLLYVKGALSRADERSIAVVGTRYATVYGKDMAERIGEELASYGFTLVSGLARGVDTAAHIGALKRGRTLAVLGCGLCHIYPRENGRLAEQIAQQGALISEFPMSTPPDRQHFPQRNRIVSGMTLASMLVEAPLESGAMITMGKARSQGRKLFALPGRVDCESFRGNHLLIKQGLAQLVESGRDIADSFETLFGHVGNKELLPPVKRPSLGVEEQALLAQLPGEELAIDQIAALTKLPITKLSVLLMSLVMKQVIREYPGKIYKK